MLLDKVIAAKKENGGKKFLDRSITTRDYSHYVTGLAKGGLTLTLFLIGCGLSGNVLRSVGLKPLLQGVVLWIVISVAALWMVLFVG